METAISQIAPLADILEQAYQVSGKRTKKFILNMPLGKLSWGKAHVDAFRSLQTSILNSTKLSYPKKEKVLCLFTDASDRFWSGVVTQTDEVQLSLEVGELKHEPLAFVGQMLNATEKRWGTYEQEGFAIFKSFENLDCLFMGDQKVQVFTDHRNLLFSYSPLCSEPILGSHAVSEVQIWAMYLSRFEYNIEHLDADANIFAEILTRWLKGYRVEQKVARKAVLAFSVIAQMMPSSDPEKFVWPTQNILRISREQRKDSRPEEAILNEVLRLYQIAAKIWIPTEDVHV